MSRKTFLIVAAFAAIYFVWGSTFLGIRYAIETIPPFLMAASRHMAAGAALYAIARAMGHKPPRREHLRDSAFIGVLLLAIGNGTVVWAEQYVASSVVALMIAAVPMWMVLMGWAMERGKGGGRPSVMTMAGMALGFVGIFLLVGRNGETGGHDGSQGVADVVTPIAALALLGSTLAWSFGTIYSRRARTPESHLIACSLQMIFGGAALLIPATIAGEWQTFDAAAVSARSALAWLYLVVFGSIIAFSAYVWLLDQVSPARLATYAYVNPVWAMLLGAGLGGEIPSVRTLLAAGVIITGVALIITSRPGAKPKTAEEEMPAEAT